MVCEVFFRLNTVFWEKLALNIDKKKTFLGVSSAGAGFGEVGEAPEFFSLRNHSLHEPPFQKQILLWLPSSPLIPNLSQSLFLVIFLLFFLLSHSIFLILSIFFFFFLSS